MIDVALAHALRDAGLRWHPATGDRFLIESAAFQADDGDPEVYTISEMTIEAHTYPTGTELGFNGTTEWALDSVSTDDSLWLPREDQMRELLGRTFHALTHTESGDYEVTASVGGEIQTFTAPDAENAYGSALLAYIDASLRIENVERP
ncbi:MAG: pilus assembly protein CpaE [Frondihabitans sp.]|nr:pilus assembly protein CpaE [Frondihabitans sp.]